MSEPKATPRGKAAPAAQVHTLLVELGRAPDDGLPQGATGGALLCYAAGRSEAEAVRETVAVLKAAGLNPLEVTAQGTLAERRAAGEEIGAEDVALMARAAAENAVVVAQKTWFGAE